MKLVQAAAAVAAALSAPASAAIILDETGVVTEPDQYPRYGVEFEPGYVYKIRAEFFGDLSSYERFGEFMRYGRVTIDLEDGGVNDYTYNDYTPLLQEEGRVFEISGSLQLDERTGGLTVELFPFLYGNSANRVPLSYRITISDNRPEPGPAVPEPATWAMMIGGFGLVGAAARRRQRARVAFG